MSTKRATPRKSGKANGAAPASGTARAFQTPAISLEPLPAQDTASLIAAASDIALVLDRRGVIEDFSSSLDDMPAAECAAWVGRPWADVVTPESRPKVKSLLADAGGATPPRWRHVNHPGGAGGDFPVMYSTVPVGRHGRVVAFGRDMRPLARLQQRLVDAQSTLERDYWRLRDVETRYRLLFDMAADAIVVLDVASGRVLEANPAVKELLGLPPKRIIGQPFVPGLPERALRDLQALLGRVRASGRTEEAPLRAGPRRSDLLVSASLFMQEDRALFLVRLRPLNSAGGGAVPASRLALLQAVERLPDGLVVTDPDGRVLLANAAFVDLAQLAAEEQLRGESLGRWLGRPGVDLNVMLATLRQQGTLRLFATVLRGEHGAEAEVEISGVALADAEPPCLGFAVRHVGRRLGTELQAGRSAPRSVEQLTQLVGRMPLKDLVRESTDLIEQLCIEAALQLTQGNRASAAEMLGLSRQSLYVKLRRYGMVDGSADTPRM